MAVFLATQCDRDFELEPEHLDWTAQFSGSVGKLQVAVEKGNVVIPTTGCYILSERVSRLTGHPVYYHATSRRYTPRGNKPILRTRTMSDIDAENLVKDMQNEETESNSSEFGKILDEKTSSEASPRALHAHPAKTESAPSAGASTSVSASNVSLSSLSVDTEFKQTEDFPPTRVLTPDHNTSAEIAAQSMKFQSAASGLPQHVLRHTILRLNKSQLEHQQRLGIPDYSERFHCSLTEARNHLDSGLQLPVGGVVCRSSSLSIQEKHPVYYYLSTGASKNAPIKPAEHGFYEATAANGQGMVICIGDIHGNVRELNMLWKALQRQLPKETLKRANIVFLGDYCDRGPDTKAVLDWLIKFKKRRENERAKWLKMEHPNHNYFPGKVIVSSELTPKERKSAAEMSGSIALKLRDGEITLAEYKKKKRDVTTQIGRERPMKSAHLGIGDTVFLAGNHDFGMACFLGCLPADRPYPWPDLDVTKQPKFDKWFWPHKVKGGMHYQGRRWGGSTRLEAAKTFASYGVDFTLEEKDNQYHLEAMLKAVPQSHKDFLRDLDWVYDIKTPWPPYRVICVHAGMMRPSTHDDFSVECQLAALKRRDLAAACLHDERDVGYIAHFSARRKVRDMPESLIDSAVLVSGHHGMTRVTDPRFIVDASGGNPSEHRPIQALVLPDKVIIPHTDKKNHKGWHNHVKKHKKVLADIKKNVDQNKVDSTKSAQCHAAKHQLHKTEASSSSGRKPNLTVVTRRESQEVMRLVENLRTIDPLEVKAAVIAKFGEEEFQKNKNRIDLALALTAASPVSSAGSPASAASAASTAKSKSADTSADRNTKGSPSSVEILKYVESVSPLSRSKMKKAVVAKFGEEEFQKNEQYITLTTELGLALCDD